MLPGLDLDAPKRFEGDTDGPGEASPSSTGLPGIQSRPAAVKRVSSRNYRSIDRVTVELGPRFLLTGPNGSGKSNVLEALRFVATSLDLSFGQPLRDRGGTDFVRRIPVDDGLHECVIPATSRVKRNKGMWEGELGPW